VFSVGGGPCPVVDAQVHIWDASPHNQAAPDGEVYALDLLRRHRELDGGTVPPLEVERVSEAGLNRDVFDEGGVDRAVLQPVVLGDLFVLGFSPLEWHAEMAGLMPDRFVLSGELDPDGGQPGARGLTPRVRRFDLRGITLCERRRPAGSMRLADPWLRRTLARCGSAGADVVHIGVGPSTRAAPWARTGEGARIGVRPTPRTGEWGGSVDGPLVGVPRGRGADGRPSSGRFGVGRSADGRSVDGAQAGRFTDDGRAGRFTDDGRAGRSPDGAQAGRSTHRVGAGMPSPAPWSRTAAAPPRRVPRVPAWAEPVRAGSAQPVRAGAAARVAPPGFDARHFRELARALPEIRFVLGAGCLPTDELVRLAVLPNVHVMLTEILPWAGSLEFAHAFGTLLKAFGAERLLFGSGYPMMRPGPLVQALATYRFPPEVARRYPSFDAAAARAVLGGNAARLYRIPLEPVAATPAAAGA
jgi:predicted TIM-barrel fold metal-dependent hydrolase